MAEEGSSSSSSSSPNISVEKTWKSYMEEDIKRSVFESTDSALRSARSLQENSSAHLQSLQHSIGEVKSQYQALEVAFLKKIKDELLIARDHPTVILSVAAGAGLLLMKGPRRFLFRHTLGRFQSEEAQFVKAEKKVNELDLSVGLMKRESKKLMERAAFAQEEMQRGHAKLKNAGNEIQRLRKSIYKLESQASDLMEGLREVSGREPLKLRAEVASMASQVKQQRSALDKRIMKISELGISI